MIKRIAIILAALIFASVASAQSIPSVPVSSLSTASNNSTLVYAGPALLKAIIVINTTNTTYFLKMYNKTTAPTCGTDTPYMRLPIPPQNTGGGFIALSVEDMRFPLGIGFCLVGGLADNDNSNAATGVALNFAIAWQ